MTRDEFVGRVQAFESAVTEVWDAEWDTEEEREALAARDRALESLLSAFDALDRCDALAEEWWIEGNDGGGHAEYEDACRDHARALLRALEVDRG